MKRGHIFCVMLFLMYFQSSFLYAGSHALTKPEYDSKSKICYFDMVVSLDWKPEQTERDGALKTAFETFAKDVFMMSEGNNKLRKLYVYTDGKQNNKADIIFANKTGRAMANINGILNSGGRILMFKDGSDTLIGHTMAHEFGHYAYGVMDEYREKGKTSSPYPGDPLEGDTPKNTIMNDQQLYQWLSIPSDYAEAKERKTAQYRVYGNSAWETIIRDPENDTTPNTYKNAFKRTRYIYDVATAPTSLTKPTNGWDSVFEIIYMEGSAAVLCIDCSGSMDGDPLAAAQSAAKQYIDLMQEEEQIAVVSFNSEASTLVSLTTIIDQASKNGIKASIDTLVAGGGTEFDPPLEQAFAVLNDQDQTTLRYVLFLSDGQASTPDTSKFQSNSIPIYTVALGSEADSTVLSAMATATGGNFYTTSSGTSLSDIYASVNRATTGSTSLAGSSSKEMSVGETSSYEFIISELDTRAVFRADWETGQTVSYTLESPSGEIITPTSLPESVTCASELTYTIYTIENVESGIWTGIVTADSLTTQTALIRQEVSVNSPLSLEVTTLGGTYPEPIGIMASLAGPEPVISAILTAKISVPDGSEAIGDIDLLDDGIAPDMRADDGIYSGLFHASVAGTYGIEINAVPSAEGAYLSTAGALASGDDAEDTPIGNFSRQNSLSIDVAADTSLLPGATPGSALRITSDNTKYWGIIDTANDEDWFIFSADSGTQYYIQTSQLAETDGDVMATSMSLIDSDASTAIQTSEGYDGTNISHIAWTPATSGDYFLRVRHAHGGTGVYVLTAGEIDIYQNYSDESEGSNGGHGGCVMAPKVTSNGLELLIAGALLMTLWRRVHAKR